MTEIESYLYKLAIDIPVTPDIITKLYTFNYKAICDRDNHFANQMKLKGLGKVKDELIWFSRTSVFTVYGGMKLPVFDITATDNSTDW